MKIETGVLGLGLLIVSAATIAADSASSPASSASAAVAAGAAVTVTTGQYILGSVIAAAGNAVHFITKNVKGETNKEMMDYLKDHSLLMGIGIAIAIVLAIIQATTIFKSGDGQLLTAFLTGYAADSFLGKYTPPDSIKKT